MEGIGAKATCTSEEITERPRDPSGVAAFMSANSKTPYITPGMEVSSGQGVVRGRRVQQLEFTLHFEYHDRRKQLTPNKVQNKY